MSIRWLMAGTVAVTLGCAHLPRGTGAEPVDLVVTNQIVPDANVALYLVRLPYDRKYLGDVPVGQARRFKFTPSSLSAHYKLLAVAPLGARVLSPEFTLNEESGEVDWEVQSNLVSFYEAHQ